jgi:pantoate--beta-alanine ligase
VTATPEIARTRKDLDALLDRAGTGGPIGLVPTMGALHAGHASLMRELRQESDQLVASIFVNPLQFGPGEDLDRYPRTFDADLAVCAAEGVDVVFAPEVTTMYAYHPTPPQVTVDPGPLGAELEGEFRPTHFAGVLTVVAKLFNLVRPDLAIFGEKDYQQLTLIRRMVVDLSLPIRIVAGPTQREEDGLALSSRNRYLSADERRAATVLSRALAAAQLRAAYGVPPARWAAMKVLQDEPLLELDYLALRDADLGELEDYPGDPVDGRILVAGRFGSTRLIDNMPLLLGPEAGQPDRGAG